MSDLKCFDIGTQSTAETKLGSISRMLYFQRTLSNQLFAQRTGGTLCKIDSHHMRIRMASVAEMSCTKAEKDGNTAAISTFILDEVCTVSIAYLKDRGKHV